jgi:F0F1-type ATP synthase membrane subunit c/vacuolar-type H+-ATPase subunit K
LAALDFLVLMGFPSVGALAAWVAALRSWRTARSQIPPGSHIREARGRLIPLMLIPSTLIVFGLVVSLLLLGETIPDSLAQPAALAYGVPGLLAGLGFAIIYRRGISAAVASRQMFGRVLPLAVMPETSAVFGLVVSFFLIGGGVNLASGMPFGLSAAWLASALAMLGGLGAPMGAWFAVRAWDFKTLESWPKARSRATRGDYVSVLCLALAMAVLAEWLLAVLLAAFFVVTLALGSARVVKIRQRRLQDGKGT